MNIFTNSPVAREARQRVHKGEPRWRLRLQTIGPATSRADRHRGRLALIAGHQWCWKQRTEAMARLAGAQFQRLVE